MKVDFGLLKPVVQNYNAVTTGDVIPNLNRMTDGHKKSQSTFQVDWLVGWVIGVVCLWVISVF